MKIRRITALFLLISILVFSPSALADFTSGNEEKLFATRGEVVKLLLEAADFYNPGLEKGDIIKGYEDGLLHEEKYVTRAEALVMLSRAFGDLPELTGHNERVALVADDFTDIPSWAREELANVFDCGIVAGTEKGIFSPDNCVTKQQMEWFIERVYALYGTNLKDDFYATVNKDVLNEMEVLPGNMSAGTIENLQIDAMTAIEEIIIDALSGNKMKGSPEQKIADLYRCVVDSDSRNSKGIEPIKPYLDMVDEVNNISELTTLDYKVCDELCVNSFMGFSLGIDLDDSNKYVLCFGGMAPLMNKEFYFEEGKKQEAYVEYLSTLLKIGGESKEEALKNAKDYYDVEKVLASVMLSSEEQNDINKMYTPSTFGKLCAMYPDFDMNKVLDYSGLKEAEKVLVLDMGMAQKFSEIYNQSNLDVLKTAMKLSILYTCGDMLSGEFKLAKYKLDSVVFGTTGLHNVYQDGILVLQGVMSDYLSDLYVEKYFDEESKKDVEEMTHDIIDVFKKRIDNLVWMNPETKEKAKKKLDVMKVKIGYPETTDSYLDNVNIIAPNRGGTYFENMLAISKEVRKQYKFIQESNVDRDAWEMTPYTVNAGYNPSANSITLPAAILQAPLYDKDASYEENLGGIGYIIAHEVTHAFDPNGAQFDEYGNLNNWWTEEDYEAFGSLCTGIENFFWGEEPIPGVQTNGKLTLNENIADIGGVACITQLAEEKGNPDYKKLYTAIAKVWANTSSREYAEYLAEVDVHSSGKIRVNRVLVNFDEFHEAFDIKEGDGMYLSPSLRLGEGVTIW